MKLPVYNLEGAEVDSIDADDLVFGVAPHAPAMRQALLAQLANRRTGAGHTKTRGEVRGSTRKIRRQKGLGAARQGAIRAPHHRHGGIVFGPKHRSFRQDLPKRVRRLAIRSAIATKLQEGALRVVSSLEMEQPKTKAVLAALAALELAPASLLVTAAADRKLLLSARNVPGAKSLPADYLNVYDLLSHRGLVMTVDAVRRAEALWGGERATKRVAPVPAAAGGANA